MKTYMAKASDVTRRWVHVDAEGKILGRLAAEVARILMGKHKPTYTPHIDTGDFVVITNAEKIELTGKKRQQKSYYRYSGYPGGLKEIPYRRLAARKPEEIVRLAVARMLPKTKLGRRMLHKLKVYRGPEHPHSAQQPHKLELRAASSSAEERKER